MISNFFVEINPGRELENILIGKKGEIINFISANPQKFGKNAVDNPSQIGYLRDPPHFTLMGGRTGDFYSLLNKLEKISKKFSKLNYEIIGIEDNPVPGNLIEVRTVVKESDRQKFKEIHLEIIEASLEFNTAGIYEKWEKGFEGEALENLKYCGFHGARNLYKPHASIGRIHKDLRNYVEHLLNPNAFDPRGKYTSGNLIVWRLPFDKDDPRAIPFDPHVIKLKVA